jgi:hypothetical protein
MKAEPILQELEAAKERLATQAGENTRRFLDQMEAWLDEHPHAGPVLHSPEQLQARLRSRESTEPPPTPGQPYRIYDPIIAEIHRTRDQLVREHEASGLILKDEPPKSKP